MAQNQITFLLGAAGTGKTQLATAYANLAVIEGRYSKVIHTRPVVECAGESLGWLPGTVADKLMPYMQPLVQCSAKTKTASVEVHTIPLAYMRGLTLDHCVAVLDEAQNATFEQLKLYLTRLGSHAKMIICGDTDQADIRDSGLYRVAEALKGMRNVGYFMFRPEDTVRSPMIVEILQRLEE